MSGIPATSFSTGHFLKQLSQPQRHRPRFEGNRDKDYSHLYETHHGTKAYGTSRYYAHPNLDVQPDGYLQHLLTSRLKPGDAILDLGCNMGNNLIPLAQKGFKLYGLDVERSVLQTLRKRVQGDPAKKNIQIKQWDFAEPGLHFPPDWEHMKGRFKAIYGTHVFSHLSKVPLIQTIQAMKDYLAPGGMFIATIMDPVDVPEHPLFEQRDFYHGFVTHDPKTVDQAFEGLSLDKTLSRKFIPGELKRWDLPESQIRWVVYVKPGGEPLPDVPPYVPQIDRNEYEQKKSVLQKVRDGYYALIKVQQMLRSDRDPSPEPPNENLIGIG